MASSCLAWGCFWEAPSPPDDVVPTSSAHKGPSSDKGDGPFAFEDLWSSENSKIADIIGGALNGAADRTARALIPLGVQHGDRFGVWSSNRAEWEITVAELAPARVTDVKPT